MTPTTYIESRRTVQADIDPDTGNYIVDHPGGAREVLSPGLFADRYELPRQRAAAAPSEPDAQPEPAAPTSPPAMTGAEFAERVAAHNAERDALIAHQDAAIAGPED
jgi:hypothetical protein